MGLWRDFSEDKLLAPCGRPRVEAGEYTINKVMNVTPGAGHRA